VYLHIIEQDLAIIRHNLEVAQETSNSILKMKIL
jgi:hypothetical protein